MTPNEQTEWNYRFEERLGMLCGPVAASAEQKELARVEANQAIQNLKLEIKNAGVNL